jgi:hypothetical protein
MHCIEDICGHNDEELRIYCFCCPAMEVDDYRYLYTPPSDSPCLEQVSAKGKSAQDIFGKCILQKNKGPAFVQMAGPGIFHTAEELHEFFVKAAGDAVAHLDYACPAKEQAESWLENMPSDEEGGWNEGAMNEDICWELEDALPALPSHKSLQSAVAEADRAIRGWKDVR